MRKSIHPFITRVTWTASTSGKENEPVESDQVEPIQLDRAKYDRLYTGTHTRHGVSTTGKENEPRLLWVIAREIRADWKKVNFAAVPYLDALGEMGEIDAPYHNDSGRSVVTYFLANAGSWRGDTARRIKGELKGMLGRTR